MDIMSAEVTKRPGVGAGIKVGGHFEVVCRGTDGKIKWEDTIENLVVNVGLQHILDTVFSGGAAIDPWYIGLTATAPSPAAGDTMASHVGWAEFTAYDEVTRQAWVEVRSGQSMTNAASKAAFTVDTDSSVIGGAFLVESSTISESASVLMAVGAFSGGDKIADDDDTLEVTYVYSAADDGV